MSEISPTTTDFTGLSPHEVAYISLEDAFNRTCVKHERLVSQWQDQCDRIHNQREMLKRKDYELALLRSQIQAQEPFSKADRGKIEFFFIFATYTLGGVVGFLFGKYLF